jgi:hypothetical protein
VALDAVARVLIISRGLSGARSSTNPIIVFRECFVGRPVKKSLTIRNCRDLPGRNVLWEVLGAVTAATREVSMLYAILAYHKEAEVLG